MQRILFIEDSESSQKVVRSALQGLDIELVCAGTLTEAEEQIRLNSDFQLILLDLVLPDGEGLHLLDQRQSSAELRRTPGVLLTGNEYLQSKVSAFELGAEDYLVKPVDPRELRARVEMHLRKTEWREAVQDTLHLGRLTLNFPMMRASLKESEGKETPIELTAKEFRLLALLAKHQGQIFTRTQLVKEIWGGDMHVVNRTVDSHICGARRKLGPAGEYIESITGTGYRFRVKDNAWG